MNFRFTWLKSIVSIVLGVIIGYLFAWQQVIMPSSVPEFYLGPFILFFIVSAVLIYIIWSLFQKRRR